MLDSGSTAAGTTVALTLAAFTTERLSLTKQIPLALIVGALTTAACMYAARRLPADSKIMKATVWMKPVAMTCAATAAAVMLYKTGAITSMKNASVVAINSVKNFSKERINKVFTTPITSCENKISPQEIVSSLPTPAMISPQEIVSSLPTPATNVATVTITTVETKAPVATTNMLETATDFVNNFSKTLATSASNFSAVDEIMQ